MHVENKWITLTLDMAVTYEIRTGKQSVKQSLLGPLIEAAQESMHEPDRDACSGRSGPAGGPGACIRLAAHAGRGARTEGGKLVGDAHACSFDQPGVPPTLAEGVMRGLCYSQNTGGRGPMARRVPRPIYEAFHFNDRTESKDFSFDQAFLHNK